jgi:hypothetical protein
MIGPTNKKAKPNSRCNPRRWYAPLYHSSRRHPPPMIACTPSAKIAQRPTAIKQTNSPLQGNVGVPQWQMSLLLTVWFPTHLRVKLSTSISRISGSFNLPSSAISSATGWLVVLSWLYRLGSELPKDAFQQLYTGTERVAIIPDDAVNSFMRAADSSSVRSRFISEI